MVPSTASQVSTCTSRCGGWAAKRRATAPSPICEPVWPSPGWSPAELLIRVLMAEGMYADAWDTVRAHGVTLALQQSLAKASEAAHPREALAVYAARVEQLVGAEGNGNYKKSARLVVHMAGLREPSEQAAYVAELRMRFKTKRNFMKLLER